MLKKQNKLKPEQKQNQSQNQKAQNDTDTILTKGDMKELADISNQFYTLLNRIDKVPNLKDKVVKELLKYKKSHIKVNDDIINLKDSNYIVIEVRLK